jgi:hypothetical protein
LIARGGEWTERLEQLLADVVELEYEEQPPNSVAVSQTKEIINDLVFLSLPSPAMVREPEGGIRFEWLSSTSHTVLIATNEGSILTFYTRIASLSSEDGVHVTANDAIRWVQNKVLSSAS